MKVIANTSFIHGPYSMVRGQEESMPESTARELEAAGLVRVQRDGQQEKHSEKASAGSDAPVDSDEPEELKSKSKAKK